MKITFIRSRLPISYAMIAALSALVLGVILLFSLQRYYNSQEFNYLSSNAILIEPGLANVVQEEYDPGELQVYVRNLSYLIQARIRLLDADENILADTGPLQSQQFVFTNLTASGMSAEILQEGRADRYLFHASINIIDSAMLDAAKTENIVFLAQVPSQPALFGVEPGTQDVKNIQHTEQIYAIPLTDSNGEDFGILEVSEGPAFGGTIVENVTRAWILASVIAVIVSAISGWSVSRQLIRPLTELTSITQDMADGDLSLRANIQTKDEFQLLGTAFNKMTEKLEVSFETLRCFVADAAHELLTPVATMLINLEMAEEENENREYVKEAQQQATRIQNIVESLLDLSKIEMNPMEFGMTSLNSVVEEVKKKLLPLAEQNDLQLRSNIQQKEIEVLGAKSQLRKVLENLVENSIKFADPGGLITISLSDEGQTILLSVTDNGPGIPIDEQPQVFKRFFRGRDTASIQGSGLGLAIVKAILDQHDATIDLFSTSSGTKITIKFLKS